MCNRCGGQMLPADSALVPALECAGCGRLVPRTGVKYPKMDRRTFNRAMRGARRYKMREGRQ